MTPDTAGVFTTSATGGGTGSTGQEPQLVNGCLDEETPPFFGIRHHCGGRIFAHFGASGLSDSETVDFGPAVDGDTYENPKVMACCSPKDESLNAADQPHYRTCFVDLVETLCRSIPTRIENAAKDALPHIKAQATKLANFVASEEGQDFCKTEFRVTGGVDDIVVGQVFFLSHTLNLPNSDDWPAIQDPFVEVVDAEVTGYVLPADPNEQIECIDNEGSDSQSFLVGTKDDPDFDLILDAGDGSLVGPQYSGGSMTARPMLASERTGCADDECSTAKFSKVGGAIKIVNALRLESFGATVVSNRDTAVTVDWFRIELVGPMSPSTGSSTAFTIDREAAVFVVSGTIDGLPHILPVSNVTAIDFTKNGNKWSNSSFALQHVDAAGDTWNFSVSSATWD